MAFAKIKNADTGAVRELTQEDIDYLLKEHDKEAENLKGTAGYESTKEHEQNRRNKFRQSLYNPSSTFTIDSGGGSPQLTYQGDEDYSTGEISTRRTRKISDKGRGTQTAKSIYGDRQANELMTKAMTKFINRDRTTEGFEKWKEKSGRTIDPEEYFELTREFGSQGYGKNMPDDKFRDFYYSEQDDTEKDISGKPIKKLVRKDLFSANTPQRYLSHLYELSNSPELKEMYADNPEGEKLRKLWRSSFGWDVMPFRSKYEKSFSGKTPEQVESIGEKDYTDLLLHVNQAGARPFYTDQLNKLMRAQQIAGAVAPTAPTTGDTGGKKEGDKGDGKLPVIETKPVTGTGLDHSKAQEYFTANPQKGFWRDPRTGIMYLSSGQAYQFGIKHDANGNPMIDETTKDPYTQVSELLWKPVTFKDDGSLAENTYDPTQEGYLEKYLQDPRSYQYSPTNNPALRMFGASSYLQGMRPDRKTKPIVTFDDETGKYNYAFINPAIEQRIAPLFGYSDNKGYKYFTGQGYQATENEIPIGEVIYPKKLVDRFLMSKSVLRGNENEAISQLVNDWKKDQGENYFYDFSKVPIIEDSKKRYYDASNKSWYHPKSLFQLGSNVVAANPFLPENMRLAARFSPERYAEMRNWWSRYKTLTKKPTVIPASTIPALQLVNSNERRPPLMKDGGKLKFIKKLQYGGYARSETTDVREGSKESIGTTSKTPSRSKRNSSQTRSATFDEVKAAVTNPDLQLSSADKLKLTSLVPDITSMITAFLPGASVASGVAGMVSTGMDVIADVKKGKETGNAYSGKDLLNHASSLGLDVATMLPFVGGVAKTAKVTRAIKKMAPVLKYAFAGIGLTNSISALNKIIEGDSTIDDWKQLAHGITALGVGTRMHGLHKGVQEVHPNRNVQIKLGEETANIKLREQDMSSVLGGIKPKRASVKATQYEQAVKNAINDPVNKGIIDELLTKENARLATLPLKEGEIAKTVSVGDVQPAMDYTKFKKYFLFGKEQEVARRPELGNELKDIMHVPTEGKSKYIQQLGMSFVPTGKGPKNIIEKSTTKKTWNAPELKTSPLYQINPTSRISMANKSNIDQIAKLREVQKGLNRFTQTGKNEFLKAEGAIKKLKQQLRKTGMDWRDVKILKKGGILKGAAGLKLEDITFGNKINPNNIQNYNQNQYDIQGNVPLERMVARPVKTLVSPNKTQLTKPSTQQLISNYQDGQVLSDNSYTPPKRDLSWLKGSVNKSDLLALADVALATAVNRNLDTRVDYARANMPQLKRVTPVVSPIYLQQLRDIHAQKSALLNNSKYKTASSRANMGLAAQATENATNAENQIKSAIAASLLEQSHAQTQQENTISQAASQVANINAENAASASAAQRVMKNQMLRDNAQIIRSELIHPKIQKYQLEEEQTKQQQKQRDQNIYGKLLSNQISNDPNYVKANQDFNNTFSNLKRLQYDYPSMSEEDKRRFELQSGFNFSGGYEKALEDAQQRYMNASKTKTALEEQILNYQLGYNYDQRPNFKFKAIPSSEKGSSLQYKEEMKEYLSKVKENDKRVSNYLKSIDRIRERIERKNERAGKYESDKIYKLINKAIS